LKVNQSPHLLPSRFKKTVWSWRKKKKKRRLETSCCRLPFPSWAF
jgi:hypothetical protein